MKRLDHQELEAQLRDAIGRASPLGPLFTAAEVTPERLARRLADQLSRFEIFDPEVPYWKREEEAAPPLPLFPDARPLAACEVQQQAVVLPGETVPPKASFSRWLMTQRGRTDMVGMLARCAADDPGFPRDGDVEAARRRLCAVQADGDTHLALDEAEIDYHAY